MRVAESEADEAHGTLRIVGEDRPVSDGVCTGESVRHRRFDEPSL